MFNFLKFLKNLFTMKAIFNINGGNFEGSNLQIKNKKIYIDGKLIEIEDKVINITVNGNIESLKVDSCDSIDIVGNVGSCDAKNGNVKITGDVLGDVETMNGNVKCNILQGNAKSMNGNISK